MFRILVLLSALVLLVVGIVATHQLADVFRGATPAAIPEAGVATSTPQTHTSVPATSAPPTSRPATSRPPTTKPVATKPPATARSHQAATAAPTKGVAVTVVVGTPGPRATSRPAGSGAHHPTPQPTLPPGAQPYVPTNGPPGAPLVAGVLPPGQIPPQGSGYIPAPPVTGSTTGTIRLANYWVGQHSVRPGQLLEVVYVIENTTGATSRVVLGASILPTGLRHAWSTRGINDPRHDLVATVPPGLSLHVRFFQIPRSLSPGSYDVGWGLKTPAGGYITFIPVAHELRVVA